MDCLQPNIEDINSIKRMTEVEWTLKFAQLQKERLTAMKALAKSKLLLVEMEMLLAEQGLQINMNGKVTKDKGKVTLTRNQDKHTANISVQTLERTKAGLDTKKKTRPSPSSPENRYNSSPSNSTGKKQTRTKLDSSQSNKIGPHSTENRNKGAIPNPVNKRTELTSQENLSDTTSVSSCTEDATNSRTPNPVPTYDRSSISSSEDNRSLTESIIAEFNKPYMNVDSEGSFSKLNASKTNQSRLSTLNSSAFSPLRLTRKRPQTKISPVSNVNAYKRQKTEASLSVNSRVLYEPPSNKLKPLHAGDPRKSYYTKMSQRRTSPIRLPVPKLTLDSHSVQHLSKNAPKTPSTVQNRSEIENVDRISTSFCSWNRSSVTKSPIISQKTFYNRSYPYSTSLKDTERNIIGASLSPACRRPLQTVGLPDRTPQRPVVAQTKPSDTGVYTSSIRRHICVPDPPSYKRNSSYIFGKENRSQNNS